jgi:putative membrane protein
MKQFLALFAFFALTAMTSGQMGQSIKLSDSKFLNEAMQGGYSEVFLARQVLKETKDPGAVNFANRMIHDHSQNDAQVAALAQSLHVKVQRTPVSDAMQEANSLRGMHDGRKVAYTYISYEVTDHQNVLNLFTQEDQTTTNPQIKKYVEATIPVLKEHLKLAQDTLHNRY